MQVTLGSSQSLWWAMLGVLVSFTAILFFLFPFAALPWVTLSHSPQGWATSEPWSLRDVSPGAGSTSCPKPPSLQPCPQLSPPQHVQPHVSKSIALSLGAAACFLEYVWARAPRALQTGRNFGRFHISVGATHVLFLHWPSPQPLLPKPCHLCPIHKVPLQRELLV